MRGVGKALPKYREHRPTGQAVVTLSGDDHYLGLNGSKASKLEYDRLITEWLANGRRPIQAVDDSAITVAKIIAVPETGAAGRTGRGAGHRDFKSVDRADGVPIRTCQSARYFVLSDRDAHDADWAKSTL